MFAKIRIRTRVLEVAPPLPLGPIPNRRFPTVTVTIRTAHGTRRRRQRGASKANKVRKMANWAMFGLALNSQIETPARTGEFRKTVELVLCPVQKTACSGVL